MVDVCLILPEYCRKKWILLRRIIRHLNYCTLSVNSWSTLRHWSLCFPKADSLKMKSECSHGRNVRRIKISQMLQYKVETYSYLCHSCLQVYLPHGNHKTKTNKLCGLSLRANYTDRVTTACRRRQCQLLRIEDVTWSAQRTSMAVFSVF
jgi:hypothetical protein